MSNIVTAIFHSSDTLSLFIADLCFDYFSLTWFLQISLDIERSVGSARISYWFWLPAAMGHTCPFTEQGT